MKKRILSLILALCLLTSLLPAAVFAAESLEAPVVEVKQKSNGEYYLEWNRVDGAVSYEVYRSTDGSEYTLWSWTSTYITSFKPFKSEMGGQYYYKVVALDENDNRSAYSNVVTLLLQLQQPKVTVKRVSTTGRLKISWEEVPYAVEYQVYRSLTGEDGSWSRISTTAKTSITNSKNMEPGTEYFYKVIALAKMKVANSEYSEIKSAVCTLAKPVVTTEYNAAKNGVKVSWEPVEGAVQYKLYRSLTGKDGSWSRISTTTKTTVNNTKNFELAKKYYYKVIALAENPAGNSDYSDVVTFQGRLNAPAINVSNVASSGKIKVSWEAAEGAVGYEVYRATSKDGSYKLMKTTTGTSYTNTSATAGKTYYYKVKAVAADPAANSDYSAAKSRTCDLPRPVITTGLNTKGQPKLSWDAVEGAVGYEVYRASTKDGTYKLMKTTTNTSYTNTSATTYETYYYSVVAVASKTSANSANSTVKAITSTGVNISSSKLKKDFVTRLNYYREQMGFDTLDWNKNGEVACRTRAAEYTIDFSEERPDGRSVDKMHEAFGIQFELGLQAEINSEDLVDTIMYYREFEDLALILMYERWSTAVVAYNNGCWCIMFG